MTSGWPGAPRLQRDGEPGDGEAGHGESGNARVAGLLAIGAVGFLLMSLLLLQSLAGGLLSALPSVANGSCTGRSQQPSKAADEGIPANYLRLYRKAAREYGIPWHVLAGIGRVETNHGRLDAPGVHSGENFAGAGGPMQFLSSTWETYGVDGNGDGVADRYDPVDAIPSAARYLDASGAATDLWGAIFAYNHAGWYVEQVLSWAGQYANGGGVAVAANFSGECARQALGPSPEGLAGKVIEYARGQLADPYVWGATGPAAFDCSGLTMMAYEQVGVDLPRVSKAQFEWGPSVPPGEERPGDLVFFDYSDDRPGVDHVGIVIGDGMLIEAANHEDDIVIDSYADSDDLVGFTRPLAHEGGAAGA